MDFIVTIRIKGHGFTMFFRPCGLPPTLRARVKGKPWIVHQPLGLLWYIGNHYFHIKIS